MGVFGTGVDILGPDVIVVVGERTEAGAVLEDRTGGFTTAGDAVRAAAALADEVSGA
jgi:hypothetical protein